MDSIHSEVYGANDYNWGRHDDEEEMNFLSIGADTSNNENSYGADVAPP